MDDGTHTRDDASENLSAMQRAGRSGLWPLVPMRPCRNDANHTWRKERDNSHMPAGVHIKIHSVWLCKSCDMIRYVVAHPKDGKNTDVGHTRREANAWEMGRLGHALEKSEPRGRRPAGRSTT